MKTKVINGVGWNCDYVATLTEKQFIDRYKEKDRYKSLPNTEDVLRRTYRLILDIPEKEKEKEEKEPVSEQAEQEEIPKPKKGKK